MTYNMMCRLDKVERVKWYAPHIRHLVLDIHAQPTDNAMHMGKALKSVKVAHAYNDKQLADEQQKACEFP